MRGQSGEVLRSDDISGIHPCADDVREYAMNTLLERKSAVLQQHLLVCSHCRKRLHQTVNLLQVTNRATIIERLAYAGNHLTCWSVHYVEDDLITSVAIRLRKKKWAARLTPNGVDAGKTTQSLQEAKKYLVDSFRSMFPQHVCTERCESYGMAELFLVTTVEDVNRRR